MKKTLRKLVLVFTLLMICSLVNTAIAAETYIFQRQWQIQSGASHITVYHDPNKISEDNIYVLNTVNSMVYLYASDGSALTSFRPGCEKPAAIALNEKYLWVADTGNSYVRRIDRSSGPSSGEMKYWGQKGSNRTKPFQFLGQMEIAVNGTYVYVNDIENSKIKVFHYDSLKNIFSNQAMFDSDQYSKMAINPELYEVWLIDKNSRLHCYSTSGNPNSDKTEAFNSNKTWGIAFDSSGYAYIIGDFSPNGFSKYRIDISGKLVCRISDQINLQNPAVEIAVNSNGSNVYLLDATNNRILKYAKTTGVLKTFPIIAPLKRVF